MQANLLRGVVKCTSAAGPNGDPWIALPDFMRPVSVHNKYSGQDWGPLQEEPKDLQGTSNIRNIFRNGSSIALSQFSEGGGKAGNDEDFISTAPSCFQ
jgi:hypothetical protein